MSNIDISNDTQIKFEFNPQINKDEFALNAVGNSTMVNVPVITTDTDANSLYVSAAGNDSNAGSYASPKLTINNAILNCTVDKTFVVIIDNSAYNGELTNTNSYFQGLYKKTGSTCTVSLRSLDYTPSDANTIYVSKSGVDTNAGTYAAPVLTIAKAKTLTDANKTTVMILDNGVYDETIIFESNFKNLYSAIGATPIITPSYNALSLDHSAVYNIGNTKLTNAYYEYFSLNEDYYLVTYQDSVAETYSLKLWNPITNEDVVANTVLLNSTNYNNIDYFDYDATHLYFIEKVYVAGNPTAKHIYKVSRTDLTLTTKYSSIANIATHLVIDMKRFNDGKWCITHCTMTGGSETYYYSIYDSSFSVINSNQSIKTFADGYYYAGGQIVRRNDGNLNIFYNTRSSFTYYCFVRTISSANVTVNAEVNMSLSGIGNNASISNNDYTMVTYNAPGSPYHSYYRILSPTLTTIISTSLGGVYSLVQTTCSCAGEFLVIYQLNGTTTLTSFSRVNEAGTVLGTNTHDPLIRFEYVGDALGYNKPYIMYKKWQTFPTELHEYITHTYNAITSAISTKIDGTTFDTDGEYFLNDIIKTTDTLSIKNCKFQNFTCPYSKSYVAVETTGALTFDNNIMVNGDKGIVATNNTVSVNNNVFANIVKDYAVTITGSGSGVVVEHNTMNNCFNGIKLVSNGGTEVLKNNIIHNSGSYSIYAQTAITTTYSIITGSVYNAALGTQVIQSNPLLINESLISIADLDLNIKLKSLGFPLNSPAYNLADDSRDAGAYNRSIVGSVTSWTSGTIAKPSKIVKNKVMVGAVNVQLSDGSIDSYYDAISDQIELKWIGLSRTDYDVVDNINNTANPTVRIYFEPITNPNTFYTFTLIRSNYTNGDKHYLVDPLIVTDVSMKFGKRYER